MSHRAQVWACPQVSCVEGRSLTLGLTPPCLCPNLTLGVKNQGQSGLLGGDSAGSRGAQDAAGTAPGGHGLAGKQGCSPRPSDGHVPVQGAHSPGRDLEAVHHPPSVCCFVIRNNVRFPLGGLVTPCPQRRHVVPALRLEKQGCV